MKNLGYTEVDCVIVDLDDMREKALNLALNKIQGEWDKDKLTALLADFDGSEFDVTMTGFDAAEVDELLNAFYSAEEKLRTRPRSDPDTGEHGGVRRSGGKAAATGSAGAGGDPRHHKRRGR